MQTDRAGGEAHTTVVMVARDTFQKSAASLAGVCRDVQGNARILFVDSGLPKRAQREVDAVAAEHDVAVLRFDRYLSPNEARNLAMQHVTTPLTVFIDNDVDVSPGWFAWLERCALETGAAVVAPTTLLAERGRSFVHQVGGEAHVEEHDGQRIFRTTQWHGESVPGDGGAERQETEEAEFHCMLVDSAWFRRVGGLDEEFLSLFDHSDFSMRVRAAGGTVWAEPRSVVSYGRPAFIAQSERDYYVLRWSDEWNHRSEHRLQEVWGVDDFPRGPGRWAGERRRYGYRPYSTPFNRLGRFGRPVVDFVDQAMQRRVLRNWKRSMQDPAPPRFTRTATWQRAEVANT